MNTILSVRQLTERLRHLVEQRFPYIWVRGEITNLSRPSSGHVYFSLKEGDSLLACVWFRGQQRAQEQFDPLTGEVWEGGPRPNPTQNLENGQELVCAGRLSIYGPRGSYQLIVDMAQESGKGQWYQAFEALKEKLASQGYFAPERKRPIPYNPQRVALVTALTGAALRDFIRIASERGLGSRIRIYPSPVQGDDAPPRLVAALQEANREAWAEVVVLIRGGGSIQDLWAFNDERLAQAIFGSALPVLTGVGHEIDNSIADFVADRSAATPSHTAQLLWSERQTHMQQVDDAETTLKATLGRYLAQADARLEYMERAINLLSPFQHFQNQQGRLAELGRRLTPALKNRLSNLNIQLNLTAERMERLMEGQCTRLEALLDNASKRLIQTGENTVEENFRSWERTKERLLPLGDRYLQNREHSLDKLELQLHGLNPMAPLARGYAVVRGKKGRLLTSARQVAPHDPLEITLADGSLHTIVETVTLHPEEKEQ